jgi:hypothetical protein
MATLDSENHAPGSTEKDTIAPTSEVQIGSCLELELENPSKLQVWLTRLEAVAGFEVRGIERVPDEARQGRTSGRMYLRMAQMWFGMNCTGNALSIGILGPVVFELGFTDAML